MILNFMMQTGISYLNIKTYIEKIISEEYSDYVINVLNRILIKKIIV